MKDAITKSLPVTYDMVWIAYLQVKENRGSAGVDKESLTDFEADLAANLYKIWNRLASGSYFPPPVKTVLIDKKSGGKRPLGIPTVGDRIAQTVIKQYIEAKIDSLFFTNSYGYRPCKSAHEAIASCEKNCKLYNWVIDLDIRNFFETINHDILIELMWHYTQEKWIVMYIQRWLQADIQQPDGSIQSRMQGTPQGGVISPLLANVYLHHVFDQWMICNNQHQLFERYADDIVVHCRSKAEAERLLVTIKVRLEDYQLEVHPDKTRLIYCKDYRRKEKHKTNSFTFLGFGFEPRMRYIRAAKKMTMRYFPSISKDAKTSIRRSMRKVLIPRWIDVDLEEFARRLNSKIRGWIQYYTKFDKWAISPVFIYLNTLIMKYLKNKYRIRTKDKVYKKFVELLTQQPKLFVHWAFGIRVGLG